MNLIYKLSNYFSSRERSNRKREKLYEKNKKHKLERQIEKPPIEEFYPSSNESVNKFYYDISNKAKEKVSDAIESYRQDYYNQITEYDIRAREFRESTKDMNDSKVIQFHNSTSTPTLYHYTICAVVPVRQ